MTCNTGWDQLPVCCVCSAVSCGLLSWTKATERFLPRLQQIQRYVCFLAVHGWMLMRGLVKRAKQRARSLAKHSCAHGQECVSHYHALRRCVAHLFGWLAWSFPWRAVTQAETDGNLCKVLPLFQLMPLGTDPTDWQPRKRHHCSWGCEVLTAR